MTERFSASVAARHMACPASANLDIAIPNWIAPVEDRTKDNAANRGTNLHEIFAKMMALPNADLGRMLEAMAYIYELRKTRRFKVLIEHSVQATWLASAPWTTVDLCLYVQDEIHIIDLKTGKIPVEVIDNVQALFYGVSLAPLAPKAKGINLHILQPWANGNEHWFADTNVVNQFMQEAIAAEARVLNKDLTFGPSDECKFCPAYPHSRGLKGKPMCPATMAMLYPQVVDEDEILSI